MVNPEMSHASQDYVLTGKLSSEAWSVVSTLAAEQGARMVLIEHEPLIAERIKSVTVTDMLHYGDLAATNIHKDPERIKTTVIRNAVTARALWERTQQLYAAKLAGQFERPLIIKTRGRTARLPTNSPLVFLDVPELSKPEDMKQAEWFDWAYDLDRLTISSLRKQLKRVDGHTRGAVYPLGIGILQARTKFLADLTERAAKH